MQKRLPGVLVAVLLTLTVTNVVLGELCESFTEVWAGDDPHVYYYCAGIRPIAAASVQCPEGSGYISNGTFKGCVNWFDWSSNCIGKVEPTAAMCDGKGRLRARGYGDPSQYYLCIENGAPPLRLFCQEGTGFVINGNTWGCYRWRMWRAVTGCENAKY